MSLEVLAAYLEMIYWQPFVIVGVLFLCFGTVLALVEAIRRIFSKS